MTDYPAAVYAPRTKSNIAGVVYNPALENIGFAEDLNYLENEVLAMIADLVGSGSAGGLKGAAVSFKNNWLAQHAADGTHGATTHTSVSTDTLSEKTVGAGITADGVKMMDGGVLATGDIYNVAWVSYSPAFTGWNNAETDYCFYKRIGKLIFVQFYATGTGVGASVAMSLPAKAKSTSNSHAYFTVGCVDNGSAAAGVVGKVVSNQHYADFHKTAALASNSFTATGTRTIFGQFCYEMD